MIGTVVFAYVADRMASRDPRGRLRVPAAMAVVTLGLLTCALLLLLAAAGSETVVENVFVGSRMLLRAAGDTVVVGEDEAGVRDKAGRAATGQTHRGILYFVEPGLVRSPAIIGLHLRCRECVERPHALVGVGRGQRQGNGG